MPCHPYGDPILLREVGGGQGVAVLVLAGFDLGAQDAGELPEDCEPAIVAQVIGSFVLGLRRVALVSYERDRFERLIDVFLTGLAL